MSIWSDIQDRSEGKAMRKEDSFIYTKANPCVPDLDVETIKLLHEVDVFTGYPPFIPGDLHEKVLVVLKDRETRNVTVSLDQLKNELSRLEDELKKMENAEADQEELGEIQKRISRLKGIIASCIKAGKTGFTFEVELLGKYVRENDGTPKGRPTIYLMWGTLKKKPNPTALTAIVYVHELMHAFFDMHEDDGGMNYIPHSYIREIEEPLAEFGMLSFMEMFDRIHPKDKLLECAKAHVKEKKESLGICHYGYGYYVFEDRRNFCVDWVSLFYRSCLFIDESDNDVIAYKSMISPISYPIHEYLCETTLFKILRPKRFCFSSNVGIYPVGAKHIKRIEIPISKGICDCRVFRADYLFMAPLEVYITFVDSSGVRVRGKSMIYKKTSKKAPIRARFYIDKDKELLDKYESTLKTGGNYLFYEDIPADGDNLAKWIAKRIV